MKPRDPVQARAKYLSATIEINGNPCGCTDKMVNYCNFLTITQLQFFDVERGVIVANLRKQNKLTSLCVLAIIICIQHTLIVLCFMKNVKYNAPVICITCSLGTGDSGDMAWPKCRDFTFNESRQCRRCAGVLISRQNTILCHFITASGKLSLYICSLISSFFVA